jgi:hypothetical protein
MKTIGAVVLAILVALAAGWFWGASGKSTISAGRRAFEERATIAETRAALLNARLSLIALNFGEAARDLATARTLATELQARLRETGQAERAGHVEIVLAHIRDAERLAAAPSRDAEASTAQAVDALKNIAPPTSPPSR